MKEPEPDAWSFVLDIAGARHQMAEAHLETGKHLERRCDFTGAVASYLQACRLQPENSECWVALGLLYNILDMYPWAEGCLRYALSLSPNHPRALCGLATRELAQDDTDAAERFLWRAQAQLGDHPDVLLGKGNVALSRDLPEEAERLYRKVLELMPDSASGNTSLGNSLVSQGRNAEAVHPYRRAHEIIPGDSRLEMNLGLAELLVGDYESGWQHYEARLRAMTVR